MNFRSKRYLIPATVVIGALAIGGTAWAVTGNDDVRGSERARVAAAAMQGETGRVTDVERSDDAGEAFDVEITRPDGTEVDVTLDDTLTVVGRDDDGDDRDDRADDADREDSAASSGTGATQDDDRRLTRQQVARATDAAQTAVSGGRVTDVDASDDRGVAYEVEVTKANGSEWQVDLDSSYAVVRVDRED